MIRAGNSVHLTPPPFPNALYGKKMKGDASKVFKVLHQVKVNNPHLDMIKQVPVYAKFVKELCTVKRGKKGLPRKTCQDPGCPTILITIGETQIEKALLDLVSMLTS